MSNNYNCERIPRKGNRLQWTGENSEAVFSRLAQHGMIGELYRDIYIQVYKDGSYSTTVNIGSWLVEGEDGKLRIYDDETHALMYRPIDDLPERLKALVLCILELPVEIAFVSRLRELAKERGISIESLKAYE